MPEPEETTGESQVPSAVDTPGTQQGFLPPPQSFQQVMPPLPQGQTQIGSPIPTWQAPPSQPQQPYQGYPGAMPYQMPPSPYQYPYATQGTLPTPPRRNNVGLIVTLVIVGLLLCSCCFFATFIMLNVGGDAYSDPYTEPYYSDPIEGQVF
ncbi:MAG: hypothetical protein LBI64_06365 [Coriobacteriales bacterium]|nr:hypothetical protein [Coriobacteriales bacterium]